MIINHFQMLLQIVSCVTDDLSTFKSIPEGWLSATGGGGGEGEPPKRLWPPKILQKQQRTERTIAYCLSKFFLAESQKTSIEIVKCHSNMKQTLDKIPFFFVDW